MLFRSLSCVSNQESEGQVCEVLKLLEVNVVDVVFSVPGLFPHRVLEGQLTYPKNTRTLIHAFFGVK